MHAASELTRGTRWLSLSLRRAVTSAKNMGGKLLPALMPSWRFFDEIAPSPRIEYSVLASRRARAPVWRQLAPPQLPMSLRHLVLRLVWNPRWNDHLYLVSCAERILADGSRHAELQILRRAVQDLTATEERHNTNFIVFRIVVLFRVGDTLRQEVRYMSRIVPLDSLYHEA